MNHNISPQGTQAPSEKHLEDWLWAHPESLGFMGTALEDPEDDAIYDFRWRQLTVASGIVDLVAAEWGLWLAVAEIKRGPIDTKAFAQLMRYMRDFKQMLSQATTDYYTTNRPYKEYMPRDPMVHGDWTESFLHGLLIGHSCDDPNLLIACDACGVNVYTYQYLDDTYNLTHITAGKSSYPKAYTTNKAASQCGIHDFLLDSIQWHLEGDAESDIRAQNAKFNAVEAAERHLHITGGEK